MSEMLFAEIFNFTLDDLHQNRAGRLSDQQRDRLSHQARERLLWLYVASGLMLAAGVYVLVDTFILNSEIDSFMGTGIGILLLILGFTVVMQGRQHYQTIVNALADSRLQQDCGTLEVSYKSSVQATTYYLKMDTLEWVISPQVYKQLNTMLHPSTRYCVYWLPAAGAILALERN